MTYSSKEVFNQLKNVVGADFVSIDTTVLQNYARDQSLVTPRKPNYVVWPDNVNKIREIVRIANEWKIPIIPYSSGTDFCGATVPCFGGILMDLKKMDNILNIDTKNWIATIEPGVTFIQLQRELKKFGLRVATPFVPPSASVLSTYIERFPVLTAADFIYGNELLLDFDVVLPNGDIFTVGSPALPGSPHAQPYGPGINFFRLFLGAQGTLGIVTKMTLKLLPIPELGKVFFMPFNSVEKALLAIQKLQRLQIGMECFALNKFNLAAMLVKDTVNDLKEGNYVGIWGANKWNKNQLEEFDNLRRILPLWTVIICLSGFHRRPEEKIRYEEEALREVAKKIGVKTQNTIKGVEGIEGTILDEMLLPYRWQKKFGYKGSCHSLSFYSRLSKVPEYENAIYEVAHKHQYLNENVGGFLLPIERARAVYCEYDLHCDLKEDKDLKRVKELFYKASEMLIDMGAFFDRPYGPWGEMIYSRTYAYTQYLKDVKQQLDPNNIMNPGKLCF